MQFAGVGAHTHSTQHWANSASVSITLAVASPSSLSSSYLSHFSLSFFLSLTTTNAFNMNPATPGFIVTLAATILLALVSFNTPIIKSIDFIKATFSDSGVNTTITLGTLGYCIDLSTNGTTCSKASVGYEFGAHISPLSYTSQHV